MDEVFAVVGKFPQKGFSKTRLAESIGDENALYCYQAMIRDFLAGYKNKANPLPLYFFYTPSSEETRAFFHEELIRAGVNQFQLIAQPDQDFFQRLKFVFRTIKAKEGSVFVHLTGTDIPDFPFHLLNIGQATPQIGPDSDGGYFYLGAPSEWHDLFNLEGKFEGGSGVFQATIDQAKTLGLNLKQLLPWSDVDNLSDLKNCLARNQKDPEAIRHLWKVCQGGEMASFLVAN